MSTPARSEREQDEENDEGDASQHMGDKARQYMRICHDARGPRWLKLVCCFLLACQPLIGNLSLAWSSQISSVTIV
jgi:hypothetical protein